MALCDSAGKDNKITAVRWRDKGDDIDDAPVMTSQSRLCRLGQ